MKIRSFVANLIALLTPFASAGIANAQTGGLISVPAEKQAIAPGGVDLRTGRYNYHQADLSIGSGDAALALGRMLPTNVPPLPSLPFGNFSHNWNYQISFLRISLAQRDQSGGYPFGSDYLAFVNYGDRTTTFSAYATSTGYGLESRGANAFLSFTGTQGTAGVVYTLETNDGTTVTFKPLGMVDGLTVTGVYATKIVKADGTTFSLDYTSFTSASGNLARLRSVTSSHGYALLMEGSGGLITKACAINLTTMILPSSNLCPSNAQATVSYTYSGSKLASVTDPEGGISQFSYGTSGSYTTMGFIKPGQSTPWLVNTLADAIDPLNNNYDSVVSQAFIDGQSYSYVYHYPPAVSAAGLQITGGKYTNAQGDAVDVRYNFPRMPNTGPGSQCLHFPCSQPTIGSQIFQQSSGPSQVTDELNRITTTDYCVMVSAGCLISEAQSFTDAEGGRTELTYDNNRNIIQAKRIAKPGSGLSDIVTSATYDCTVRMLCAKPSSMTDANGKTTNYTYDTTHGGLLTETKPADPGGIQAVTRNAYVQRYAWLSNGSGGFTMAATPVWLLSTTKFCRTTATVSGACAGGSTDEVVTTYDYGPNSGPNNLLLRGKVVTADGISLRTCYAYDALGNKISETSPRAGLTGC